MCFHQRYLQWSFCSLNVECALWLLGIYFQFCRRIHLKVFRRIYWKNGILIKIKSAIDGLVITWRKFPNKISWEQQRQNTFDSSFNGRFMTSTSNGDSWLKWLHLYHSSVFTYPRLNFKNCKCIHAERHILDTVKQLRFTFRRE